MNSTPPTSDQSTSPPQKPLLVLLDEMEQRANAATPGPWKKCSASDGKCRCEDIWSVPADSPVCSCNSKWGDPYASIRFVEGDAQGTIGAKAEAYEDLIEYGDIGEAAKQANKDFIAAARSDVPKLVNMVRQTVGELQNIINADFKGMREAFGADADRQFREWAQNRARNTLAQLLLASVIGGEEEEEKS